VFDCAPARRPLGPEFRQVVGRLFVALLRFLGCTAAAHEFAQIVGGDDIALRAAIAPVLGGQPGEFVSSVMPRIGAVTDPSVVLS
jgi:hypothetical protein